MRESIVGRRLAACRLASWGVALAMLMAAGALALPVVSVASPPVPSRATPSLDGTHSPQALLAQEGTDVVVALFSLPGCPYCEVVRRNYLRHLVGEVRGVRVVEYEIGDERPFVDRREAPATADALAESLGVRMAPTVVFLGKGGNEVAERLVGYNAPDFYGAYLDRRIASARERAQER